MSLQQKYNPKRKADRSEVPSTSKRWASTSITSPVSSDTSEAPLANAIADRMVLESPVLSAPPDGALASSLPATDSKDKLSTLNTPENPFNLTHEIGTESNTTSARVWDGTLAQGNEQITLLYTKGKNIKKSGVSPEELARRKIAVRAYLFYLEHEVKASSRLKKDMEKLKAALQLILPRPQPVNLPRDIEEQVARVFQKFEDENWGVNDEPEGHESDDEPAPNITSSAARTNPAVREDSLGTTLARQPPPEHPIWGIAGIMHGLMRKPNQKGGFSYIFDKRYIDGKKDCKVIGSNGLTPGDWWPFQRVALYHGAHGSAGGGISGSPNHGCYSIVISGRSAYHDMDRDEGETLFYSADSSLDNTDPNEVGYVSNKTKSLDTSQERGLPVRVLRSEGNKRAYAPLVGIRYDGLYYVAARRRKTNSKGGLYYQYKLRRLQYLPGTDTKQRSFTETVNAAPTGAQQRDYSRIRDGY